MTIRESITILTDYNKWRRSEPPYDANVDNPDNYRRCRYNPKEIGEAIDTLTEWSNSMLDGKAMIVDKDWISRHDALRLDKAVEWLRQHVNDYLYNRGGFEEYIPTCGDMLFEDFRNAMD